MRSLLTKWLSHLLPRIPPRHEQLTKEQESYLGEWRQAESIRSLRSLSAITAYTALIAGAGVPFLLPTQLQTGAMALVASIFLITVSTLAFTRMPICQDARVLRIFLFFIKFTVVGSFTLLFHQILTAPDISRTYQLIAGIFWMNLLWYVGALGAIFGRNLLWLKILLLAPSFTVFYLEAESNTLAIAVNVIFLDAFVLLFFMALNQRSEAHALLEMKSKELELQNEKLQIQAIDSELNVARELQKNLARPPESTTCGEHLVHVYQVPASKLGGDWVAARTLADGRHVVAIGDGTGTGIPAAMVVQAVQSLWTASIHDPQWTPEAWFNSVNRTLRIMRRETPHTLALGLLVLGKDEAMYYSAGPMPMYLVGDNRIAESIRPIVGDGHLLGIYADPMVKPISVTLPELTPYALMIATDGVINKRAIGREHRMFDLLGRVREHGVSAVRFTAGNEDKVLVMIERRRTAEAAA